MWKGFYMERILRSFDAALLVLYIMTAPQMPKKVYMEEIIELIVSLTRYNLQHNIFPEYDPLYKIEPDSKGKPGRALYCNRHFPNLLGCAQNNSLILRRGYESY